ncbi:MAG: glycosyltransferase family 39 protein [Clostridia bacterium]|nr:glycosyltransferase family 39 protein [Clostridia bacterium]
MKQPKRTLVKAGAFAGAAALLLLLIWVFPMTMKTCYLRFRVPSLPEGTASSFTVYADSAFEPCYTVDATVQDGAFLIKLVREYLAVDRVEIGNAQAADAVTALEVRGNAVGLADYTAAALDTGVIVHEGNRTAALSPAALDAVSHGVHNPWMMRVLGTLAVVMLAVFTAGVCALHKRFGMVTTLTVVGIGVGCVCMVGVAALQGLFEKTIPLGPWDVPNWLPVLILTAAMAVLCVLCLLIKEGTRGCQAFIVVIYAAALLLGVGKMAFYTERVANAPDEPAHIGYVAYLTKTGELVPQFENIELAALLHEDDHTMLMTFAPGTMSYLKHPPTYYHIMRLANAVEFHNDGTFTVYVERMRLFSMAFVAAAIVLLFYLGFTRLKQEPVVHLLYAAVCTMVPMLMFTSAGINNDSFSLFTVALFFWGIVRYLENKRNAATYWLITVGISLSVITKVTAGIVVALTALIVLTVTLCKERSIRELTRPAFLLSLLALLVPAVYFGYVFLKYGGIQPNMFSLDPAYARTTDFYVDIALRESFSFVQYILYFFAKFMETWTGIFGHVTLPKDQTAWLSLQNVALVAIWCFPLLYTKRNLRDKTPYSPGIIAAGIGVAVAVILQLFNGFNVFTTRGYLGGIQSRYYLCAIMFFAWAAAVAVEKALAAPENGDALSRRVRDAVKAVTVLYVGLLFYEDILYFLMHYDHYV